MNFLPLGGADDIGSSCFYMNIAGTGILLDCGIHPQKNGVEALPDFELLNNHPIDFVFISHAHQDHIGSLPFLIQKYPHVIIYSTPQTREISEITLHNAANILAQNESDSPGLRIYTHDEIELLVRSIREINYNEEIELTGMRHLSEHPLKISFHNAGHILGSAGILLEHNGRKIFYTGDINLSNQSLMNGAKIKRIRNIDTLILESTYGSTDSNKIGTWDSEKLRFAKALNKVLLNGGSVLVPVFALGKTQEILALINDLMISGKIMESNIYTGGVSRHISHIYDRNKYKVDRLNPNLSLSDIEQNNFYDFEDLNYFKKNPGIVLASSGMMLKGTASYKLMEYWIQQNDFAIFGVGYMDPETPGYKIINSSKGDKIQTSGYENSKIIKCAIDRFYFSAHSKREELIKITGITNPKNVIMVHGEDTSKDWIGLNILKNFPHIKLYSAENQKEIDLG